MKETELNNRRIRSFAGVFAAVGLVLLLLFFPFVMHNGYHDITKTRFVFFSVVSALVFFGCGICTVFKIKNIGTFLLDRLIDTTAADVFMFCFTLAAVLSACFSDFGASCIYGTDGRYMGLLTWLAVYMCYIWISRYCENPHISIYLCGIALTVIVLFAWFQFENLDLFHLFRQTAAGDKINFISPLGNINIFSSYLSLFLPVFMFLYCFQTKGKVSVFFAVCAFFGFAGLAISNSDSTYVAYFTAFAVLFLFCLSSKAALLRFFDLGILFCSALIVFALLYVGIEAPRKVSALSEIFVCSILPYAGLTVCIILRIIVGRCRENPVRLVLCKKIYTGLLCAFVLGILGAVVYCTFFVPEDETGTLTRYFKFCDSWGTDRGFVWKRLLLAFADAPLTNKLFGFGNDTDGLVMALYFSDEMQSGLGYIFDSAHNEFLHHLISTGLFGLVSYIGLLISSVRTAFRSGSLPQKAFGIAVIVYAVQSFFVVTQPISTPFLFIVLALMRNDRLVSHEPTGFSGISIPKKGVPK